MEQTTLLSAITGVLAALGGYEGVKWLITFFVHRRQMKRIKESETSKAETEADSDRFHLYVERIEELRDANVELSKQNLELLKAGARKDDIIEDKTAKIRDLQDALNRETRRNGLLEKALMYYKNWYCSREFGDDGERCGRRKPPQNPPLKYAPLALPELTSGQTL